jgi:hypothetical protein
MRRIGLLVVVLASVTGCDVDMDEIMDQLDGAGPALDVGASDRLSAQSRVVGSNDGVHMAGADESVAVVGLSGMTCQVQTDTGWMATDVDSTYGNDTIEDGRPDETGGDIVLVTTPDSDEILQVDSDDGVAQNRVTVPGLVGTRFSGEQIVTVSDDSNGCVVQWLEGSTVQDSTAIPDASCQGGTVDVEIGADSDVWVALGDSLALVTPSGARTFDVPADLVAWDAAAGVTYTAVHGSDVVSAVEPSGSTRWTVQVGGPVVGLADMGPLGQAAVSVEDNFEHSYLTFLDGEDGAVIEDVDVNRPAGEVHVSEQGDALALGQDGGVDFFGVSLE